MSYISHTQVNPGTARETFLYNQLKQQYPVVYTDKGDFLADNKYTIEVGAEAQEFSAPLRLRGYKGNGKKHTGTRHSNRNWKLETGFRKEFFVK